MKGTVLWYDIRKGYGFIRGEDGNDVFVHRTDVPFWAVFLNEGDAIEYVIEPSKRGIKATNIKML